MFFRNVCKQTAEYYRKKELSKNSTLTQKKVKNNLYLTDRHVRD